MSGATATPEIDVRPFAREGAFEAQVIDSAFNNRIQVVDYHVGDPDAFVQGLRERASSRGLGKVFMKARDADAPALEAAGMEREATITGYYHGEDAAVLALFVDPGRREQPHLAAEQEILEAVRSQPADPTSPPLPEGYRSATATPGDAPDLAALYQEVFASYPYPIRDADYLVETMASHVIYRIVRDQDGRVVAAASAETSPSHSNAEMTDFATLPDQRRKGLALHLLAGLEEEMERRGIVCLYTIARARSFGMTRVFYNRGYVFTGTLVNNCNISGGFEDMHVWCRG